MLIFFFLIIFTSFMQIKISMVLIEWIQVLMEARSLYVIFCHWFAINLEHNSTLWFVNRHWLSNISLYDWQSVGPHILRVDVKGGSVEMCLFLESWIIMSLNWRELILWHDSIHDTCTFLFTGKFYHDQYGRKVKAEMMTFLIELWLMVNLL